jgi:hypothetical protein
MASRMRPAARSGSGWPASSQARAEVLWVLHRTGPRTQRELSQLLKCTPRNVTGLVDALQRAGSSNAPPIPATAARSWCGSASRASHSSPTGAADRARGTAQVLGGIPTGDLAVFSAVLDQVLARLRAAYRVN